MDSGADDVRLAELAAELIVAQRHQETTDKRHNPYEGEAIAHATSGVIDAQLEDLRRLQRENESCWQRHLLTPGDA